MFSTKRSIFDTEVFTVTNTDDGDTRGDFTTPQTSLINVSVWFSVYGCPLWDSFSLSTAPDYPPVYGYGWRGSFDDLDGFLFPLNWCFVLRSQCTKILISWVQHYKLYTLELKFSEFILVPTRTVINYRRSPTPGPPVALNRKHDLMNPIERAVMEKESVRVVKLRSHKLPVFFSSHPSPGNFSWNLVSRPVSSTSLLTQSQCLKSPSVKGPKTKCWPLSSSRSFLGPLLRRAFQIFPEPCKPCIRIYENFSMFYSVITRQTMTKDSFVSPRQKGLT